MIHVTLLVRNPDGGTTGYKTNVTDVPRRSDEILLVNDGGILGRYRVSAVRHVLCVNAAEMSAGWQLIEVECE